MTDVEHSRAFGNTAPSTALPDLTHRIHFARTPGRRWNQAETLAQPLRAALLFPLALAIVVAAALKITLGAGWEPHRVGMWGLVALLVLLPVLGLARRRAARRWQRRNAHLPAVPDAAFRLQCVGGPEELARVGELRDVPFEPRKYWAPVGLPAARARLKWTVLCALVGFVGALCVWRVLGALGGYFYVYASVVIVITHLLLAAVAPTYVGVMPGRIALLQHLPAGPVQGWEFDLRTARVLVDLHAYVIALADEAGQPLVSFSYAAAPRRRELGYYVFLAALSIYEPPTARASPGSPRRPARGKRETCMRLTTRGPSPQTQRRRVRGAMHPHRPQPATEKRHLRCACFESGSSSLWLWGHPEP